jgi:predicted GIY-YIG superfamily endonuclease
VVSVYTAQDQRGRLCFVGCTRNLARRSREHAERGWTLEELAQVDDMDTARGLEQMIIDAARERRSAADDRTH